MRTGIRSFSVLACAVAFVAIVTASCGDKSNPVSPAATTIVGTWNLDTVTMGASTIPASTLTMMVVSTYNADYTYRTIMNIYIPTMASTDTQAGTWTTSGDKLIMTVTGSTVLDTATYSISGTTLHMSIVDPTNGPMTMVFARQ
jgi:hypothetical protein